MMDSGLSRLSKPAQIVLQQYCVSRMEVLRSYRWTWWAHWSALAEMFLPRRYRYFVQPNTWARGSPINQSIVDETGLLAARTLATGLLSGLTDPTTPWMLLGLHGIDEVPEGPVKNWLAECTQRILTVYANSNFYQALGQSWHDKVVFGSAALIQYEDEDDVVNFQGPPLGEFFFGLNNKNEVDTLYREYTYTVKQTVDEFGLENVSVATQELYKTASGKDTEIIIGHAIEPNSILYEGGAKSLGCVLPKKFKFREVFWERSANAGPSASAYLLRLRGYNEAPFVGQRWDVTSNDAYGRSPGMDALPAVRQLQTEQRRKAEAIDKMVRPPMKASVSMKNEPMDILPGGVTYVTDMSNQSGFAPAFQVEPRISEMMEDLKEVQDRVRNVMFNNLFTTITDLDTVRTATDINARKAEALVLIGPVIERTEADLDQIVSRTFSIMARRGLFPPAPPEIQGMAIAPRYISMLAEVQRSTATTSIERLLGLVGSLVAVQPNVIDNIDTDEAIEHYADLLNVPPNVIRSTAELMQIRQQRAQQEQAAQAAQTGQALAQGAQTLSQTDVGAGQNALQLMLGRQAA